MAKPEVSPLELASTQQQIQRALRDADEQPDQMRVLHKAFEDVLDTVHSNPSRSDSTGPSLSEREELEQIEREVMSAFGFKLKDALTPQGLRIAHLGPTDQGYYLVVLDREGREFETLLHYQDGAQMGEDFDLDKLVGLVRSRILEARDNYYRRALVIP